MYKIILSFHNIFIFNHVEACCCSFWLTWDGQNNQCGCNIFGCNCNFADDDICYYGPDEYCEIYETTKDGGIEACQPGEVTKVICRSNERCSAIAAKEIVGSISTIILTSNFKIILLLYLIGYFWYEMNELYH